eukprot:c23051_g1_i3 orf=285-548(+)
MLTMGVLNILIVLIFAFSVLVLRTSAARPCRDDGQVLPNRELRPSEAAHLFIKRLQMQSVALRETNGQLDKEEDAFVFSARLKCTKL